MRLFIVRHGETEWNVSKKMQGCKDSPLTVKGKTNARLLGESLGDINFDKVYCSPLGRANETATLILANKDVRIEMHDAIREMSFGCWEGMEQNEIESLYPIQKYNFWNRPDLYQSIDGESFEDVIERVKNFLDFICNKKHQNVLIVSHTIVIKAIYSLVKGDPLNKFWSPPYIHDTCLTVIDWNEFEKKIILEADVSHIQKARKAM